MTAPTPDPAYLELAAALGQPDLAADQLAAGNIDRLIRALGQCPACGGPMPPAKRTGRPRKWCSDKCRVAARGHSAGIMIDSRRAIDRMNEAFRKAESWATMAAVGDGVSLAIAVANGDEAGRS
jgi:hypothetical protein